MNKQGWLLTFGSILIFSSMSYANVPIYLPEKINCHDSFCEGIDSNYFKVVQNKNGTFVFDYAYADPAAQGGYSIVYVYREPDSASFANALEVLWIDNNSYPVPYFPGSSWNWTEANDATLNCKGYASQCGFVYKSINL